MNVNKPKTGPVEPLKAVPPVTPAPPSGPIQPLFRSIDWFSFGFTALLVFIGYLWTLAPDLTLEDSGELAVASMYAGVPHPPGYPVWTIYTWLFAQLPISNIAYRVGLSSAFAGALACGLVALMVSRGSSMIIEGIAELRNIARNWENWICIVSGFVAGLLIGFNGFMWSQSVIVEVYTLSVLSLAGVLACLMRWIYAPHQNRYLYLAFFWFGICFNNHQSLLVVALGLEVAVVAVQPRLGRDLFFWNTIIYLGGLVLRQMGLLTVLTDNTPLFVIYNLIGLISVIAWAYLAFTTKKRGIELARDFLMIGTAGYLLTVFAHITGYTAAFEHKTIRFVLFNIFGLAVMGAFIFLILRTKDFTKEWLAALASGGAWALGAAFYLYMPLASMSNPPLNWGYPRIVSGFFHAFTRGQYEKIHPTTNFFSFIKQIWMYFQGAVDEFNLAYLLLAAVPFFFWKRMQKRERAWLIGLSAVYLCLSLFLLILLNPGTDRQARDLNKVFFTASHVMIAMAVGYGLTFIAGMLLTNYERWRRWVFLGGLVAGGIGLVFLLLAINNFANPLVHYTAAIAMLLPLAVAAVVYLSRAHAPIKALLALFALMPLWPIMSHWEENEQRGHLFGYWFGHDMFTPPFGIFPEMTRDAVLFGGTDPGRFNPTYMIFCESFIPPSKKPNDPNFDRRDVYLITQNALADGTYLNYIRAHYNRSAQMDPGFFSELLRGPHELAANKHTNIFARMMVPIDRFLLQIGDNIEKSRRAGTSFFKPDHFTDLPGLVARLKQQDALSKFLYGRLRKETQELVNRGGPEPALRKALAEDLNQRVLDNEFLERRKLEDALMDVEYSSRDNAEKERLKQARVDKYRAAEHQLYSPERFQNVKISDRTLKFMDENPASHTLIRLNRILLEEALPGLIAKSKGGVYPDREIKTPTPEDSQRCFHEYLTDAQRRLQLKQLRPGEDVRIIDNRVQVSGQVAVMAINGLLTKVIFDNNPGHEFFVEESFALDWMYPHLTPYGIIMKINREQLPELTEPIVAKDHEFWSKFSGRAIGNWITYDTPVSNICAFAEKVYYRRDYRGFQGDPKFIRDSDGQKAFSKLRSSIAGVYAWRVQKAAAEMQKAASEGNNAESQKKASEYQRMLREAEFSFKQSYAFCPYSPEAIIRYINLLASIGRIEDARLIAITSQKLDPFNLQMKQLVHDLDRLTGGRAGLPPEQPVVGAPAPDQMAQQIAQLESMVKENSNNLQAVYQLAMSYAQAQQPNKALALVDRLLNDPKADTTSLLFAAQICNHLNQLPRVEIALGRIAQASPDNPEVWFDLAGVQALLKKETQAIDSLRVALEGSAKRLAKDPKAPNLHSNALLDSRLNSIRQSPGFQRLITSK